MGSIFCLAKMELDGIPVNVVKIQKLVKTLKDQCNAIEKKAFELAGRHFSFTSSADIAKVIGLCRGKKGKVSTNKQVLAQNDHPISDLVLKWRKLSSTLTRMIYPLIRLVESGRIHGNCITISQTGRVSMHEPNLQNVAKDFKVVDPITEIEVNISCRSVFECVGSSVLVSADYCQLELRLLAHFSKDPSLCAIMKTDEDVFKSIAAKWSGVPECEVKEFC